MPADESAHIERSGRRHLRVLSPGLAHVCVGDEATQAELYIYTVFIFIHHNVSFNQCRTFSLERSS